MVACTWGSAARIIVKAALLFVALNGLFALAEPLNALGKLSLYNRILPGRERLPYGENPAQSYNLSLHNLPAMFASHRVSRARDGDEFRVLVLGDSGTWGWLLENDDTLAGQINARGLQAADGRWIIAYNLGYPIMSLTKDLLLLDYAMRYQPDLIVWLVTLESFPRERQLLPPLVQNNAGSVRRLIETYALDLDAGDRQFVELSFVENTLVGQRRALADLLRLQLYGFSWAATGIDQFIPADFPLRASDFAEDISWQDYDSPQPLTHRELAFDVLAAGFARAGEVPVLLVNEPIFISSGQNSHLRYNFFYPRWAYDAYRNLLAQAAEAGNWHLLDLWDALPPEAFTDSPVHTTPEGVSQTLDRLLPALLDLAAGE